MTDVPRLMFLTVVLWTVGMWLVLPGRGNGRRCMGAALLAVAFTLGAAHMPRTGTLATDAAVLVLVAATVAGAVGTVAARKLTGSAAWLVPAVVGHAGLVLFARAPAAAAAGSVVFAWALLAALLFVFLRREAKGNVLDAGACWEPALSAAAATVFASLVALSTTAALRSRGATDPGELALANRLLVVGALLSGIGLTGILARRNLLVSFFALGLFLLGAILSLVAFGTLHEDRGGEMLAVVAMAATVFHTALALVLALAAHRHTSSLDVATYQELGEPNG